MKKVGKILLVAVFATFGFQSLAQTFGVQAGLNLANVSGKEGGESIQDNKMLMGFNVGATVEFGISDAMAFQTGLVLNTKGVKFDYEGADDPLKVNVMALDIPLNIRYKFNNIYVAAGPYVGFNISGKMKMGDVIDESLEFGNDAEESDLKRLDFGVNVGAGVEFGAIGVGVQYGLGLANLTPEGDSDNKMNNRVLSFGVSYKFGQ